MFQLPGGGSHFQVLSLGLVKFELERLESKNLQSFKVIQLPERGLITVIISFVLILLQAKLFHLSRRVSS